MCTERIGARDRGRDLKIGSRAVGSGWGAAPASGVGRRWFVVGCLVAGPLRSMTQLFKKLFIPAGPLTCPWGDPCCWLSTVLGGGVAREYPLGWPYYCLSLAWRSFLLSSDDCPWLDHCKRAFPTLVSFPNWLLLRVLVIILSNC